MISSAAGQFTRSRVPHRPWEVRAAQHWELWVGVVKSNMRRMLQLTKASTDVEQKIRPTLVKTHISCLEVAFLLSSEVNARFELQLTTDLTISTQVIRSRHPRHSPLHTRRRQTRLCMTVSYILADSYNEQNNLGVQSFRKPQPINRFPRSPH